jgi:hypothetical protein
MMMIRTYVLLVPSHPLNLLLPIWLTSILNKLVVGIAGYGCGQLVIDGTH